MDGAGRPLQVVALLALLLTLLLALELPPVLTSNRTRRQENLRCHVCEKENDFGCTNEQECEENVTYCNLVAVKILSRFFYVSKQCSMFCPYVMPILDHKSFLIEKPMPFFYVNCCKGNLCNLNAPNFKGESFREQADRASVRSHSRAMLTVVMASATIFAGLSLL
ncbi:lymphocyte antigen 6K [Marmota flaviventris]|uniref:lymphocyte antigen 6K n=1 Tax=Marmota flaviventris TaxID=93162 RepID=UPI003A84007E